MALAAQHTNVQGRDAELLALRSALTEERARAENMSTQCNALVGDKVPAPALPLTGRRALKRTWRRPDATRRLRRDALIHCR